MLQNILRHAGNLFGAKTTAISIPEKMHSLLTEMGYHPFVVCFVAGKAIVCPTQNELGAFRAKLQRFKGQGLFLNGFLLALEGKPEQAVTAWHNWLLLQDSKAVYVHLNDPHYASLPEYHGYPTLEVQSLASSQAAQSETEKAAGLSALLDAWQSATGNDDTRRKLAEAAMLALVRYHASQARYPEAIHYIERALASDPDAQHIAKLGDALSRKINGAPLTYEMKKMLGEITIPVVAPSKKPPMSAERQILSILKEAGNHPFLINFWSEEGSAPLALVCADQNEIEEYKSKLTAFRGRSKFWDAFGLALQYEVYDAAWAWHDWVFTADRKGVKVHLDDPIYASLSRYHRYPAIEVYDLEPLAAAQTTEEKAACLLAFFEAWLATTGNDRNRYQLAEALALALSRYYGTIGEYAKALSLVDAVMEHMPWSIYMKTCRSTLIMKINGEAVPERLEKFVGVDHNVLKSKVCSHPFRNFEIGPNGDVLLCCGHWLPTVVGNFMESDMPSILNSDKALSIRESMLDGSYKYCNSLECVHLIDGSIPDASEVVDASTLRAMETGDLSMEGAQEITFAFDKSCNLACPSCRTELIIEKPSQNQAKADAIEQKLMPTLRTSKMLRLNYAGEIFASKASRKILEMISRKECPDLTLDIISNGMLFTRKEWAKFPQIHDMVASVRVSTDAAQKDTFEKLRFLAVFETFVENMTFLGELRQAGTIGKLSMTFTYQLDNFRQMVEFVEFAKQFHVDWIQFERLQNMGAFTNERYIELAVHRPGHPLHEEFLSVIQNPVLNTPFVWRDYGNGYCGVST